MLETSEFVQPVRISEEAAAEPPASHAPCVYPAADDGHEYTYRRFLGQRFHDGETQVLAQWEPTWKPVHNVGVFDLRAFHDQHCGERLRRRASLCQYGGSDNFRKYQIYKNLERSLNAVEVNVSCVVTHSMVSPPAHTFTKVSHVSRYKCSYTPLYGIVTLITHVLV